MTIKKTRKSPVVPLVNKSHQPHAHLPSVTKADVTMPPIQPAGTTSVEIKASKSGKIAKVAVVAGQQVKKGETVLFQMYCSQADDEADEKNSAGCSSPHCDQVVLVSAESVASAPMSQSEGKDVTQYFFLAILLWFYGRANYCRFVTGADSIKFVANHEAAEIVRAAQENADAIIRQAQAKANEIIDLARTNTAIPAPSIPVYSAPASQVTFGSPPVAPPPGFGPPASSSSVPDRRPPPTRMRPPPPLPYNASQMPRPPPPLYNTSQMPTPPPPPYNASHMPPPPPPPYNTGMFHPLPEHSAAWDSIGAGREDWRMSAVQVACIVH